MPWTNRTKTPQDHLIDIVVQLATLLEQFDLITAHSTFISSPTHLFTDTYEAVHASLHDWHTKCWPEASYQYLLDANPSSGPVSTTDISTASLVTLYWTTCLILYHHIHCASLLLPYISVDATMETLCTKAALDGWASSIANTVPILLHSTAGVFGAEFAMFPISMALVYLTQTAQLETETAVKLVEMCSATNGRKGLQRFILGVVKDWHKRRTVRAQPSRWASTEHHKEIISAAGC